MALTLGSPQGRYCLLRPQSPFLYNGRAESTMLPVISGIPSGPTALLGKPPPPGSVLCVTPLSTEAGAQLIFLSVLPTSAKLVSLWCRGNLPISLKALWGPDIGRVSGMRLLGSWGQPSLLHILNTLFLEGEEIGAGVHVYVCGWSPREMFLK